VEIEYLMNTLNFFFRMNETRNLTSKN